MGSGLRDSDSPEHDVARCKSCGKEAELEDGFCPECKWEIEAGLKHPPELEKKRSFWSILKREHP
jgi:predicted amidophosphoribosyltransferase